MLDETLQTNQDTFNSITDGGEIMGRVRIWAPDVLSIVKLGQRSKLT